jgi:hypothetical protein
VGQLRLGYRRRRHIGYCNTFALALGSILDPAFRIEDAESAFHFEAHSILEAALTDRLAERLLYAFLSSNRFTRGTIQPPEGAKTIRANNLPPVNRRFDFRIRPYSRLVAGQRAHDAATMTRRSVYDIQMDVTKANIALDAGFAHSDHFPPF